MLPLLIINCVFLKALPLKLISDASQFVGPIFLSHLLKAVEDGQPKTQGFLFAGGSFEPNMLMCKPRLKQGFVFFTSSTYPHKISG